MKVALVGAERLTRFQMFFDSLRTPTGESSWQGCTFYVNPIGGNFDAVIALQSMDPLFSELTFQVPPTRVALVVLEPPSLLELPEKFEAQFYRVLSQNPRGRPPRHILDQSGHGWFVERSINDILAGERLTKSHLISSCTSMKRGTRDYERRIGFLEYCSKQLPFQIDWFGHGTSRPAARKLDALGPYKYTIVLENSLHRGYFTEKIMDAFVSDCYPFYWGCPNLGDYFPKESFSEIDIFDFGRAIQKIVENIERNAYESSAPQRAEARRLCATSYNRYPTLLRLIEALPPSLPKTVTIRPHDCFAFSGHQKNRLRARNISGRLRRALGHFSPRR